MYIPIGYLKEVVRKLEESFHTKPTRNDTLDEIRLKIGHQEVIDFLKSICEEAEQEGSLEVTI